MIFSDFIFLNVIFHVLINNKDHRIKDYRPDVEWELKMNDCLIRSKNSLLDNNFEIFRYKFNEIFNEVNGNNNHNKTIFSSSELTKVLIDESPVFSETLYQEFLSFKKILNFKKINNLFENEYLQKVKKCFITEQKNLRLLQDNICGDGIKSPEEKCDDNNTKNNDGCSSNCTIEPFYNCSLLNGTTSICLDLKSPYYLVSKLYKRGYNSDNVSLLLNFSKIMKPLNLTLQLKVEVDGLNNNKEFRWSYEMKDQKSYVIYINFFASFQEKNVIFKFYNPAAIQDLYNISLSQVSYVNSFLIDEFIYYSEKEKEIFTILFDFLSYFMLGTLFAFFPLFLIESLCVFWMYIERLQLLNLMLYIKVELPQNVIVFFKALEPANFYKKDYLSKLFSSSSSYVEGYLPDRFYIQNMGSAFLDNAVIALLFLGFILVLYTTVKFLNYIFLDRFEGKKCSSWFVNILITLEKYMEYSSIIRTCMFTFTSLFLFSLLQLNNINFENNTNLMHSVLGIACMIYLVGFVIFKIYFLNIKIVNFSDPEVIYKWNPLFDMFKRNAFFKKNFTVFFTFRKIIWIVAIVFLEGESLNQLFAMVVCNIFIIIFMAFKKPYIDYKINTMNLVSEILLLAIMMLISTIEGFKYLYSNGLSIEVKMLLCWVIVGLSFSLILLKFVFMLFEIFSNITKLVSNTNNLIQNINKKEIIGISDGEGLEMTGLNPNDVDVIKEENEEEEVEDNHDESAKRINIK